MRRYALIAGLALVATGALPAHATGVRYRTVTAPYKTAGGVGDAMSGDATVQGEHYGSVLLTPRGGEYAVSVSATEDKTGSVLFEVRQGGTSLGYFCNATRSPLALPKRTAEITVYILAGQCGGGVAVPTTGTVTAKLVSKTR
jgi:hypothetical protein